MSGLLFTAASIGLLDALVTWLFLMPHNANQTLALIAWFGACNYFIGAGRTVRRDAWRDR